MALPFSFSSELKWSDNPGSTPGPFQVGTALYAVLVDKTANTIEVWKSTDGGDSWAEQHAAGHPACSTTAGRKSASAAISGATIHVAYHTSSDKQPLGYATFSTTTDTWTASGALSASKTSVGVSGTAWAHLTVRSDGDVIVLYQANTEAIMGTPYRRVSYSRLEGGTWTQDTSVSGTGLEIHYDARAIVLGSSDRAHLVWNDVTNADLKHRTLTSANALQAIQDIDTSVNVGNYSVGLPVLDSSTVRLPYVDSTGDLIEASATSADEPTWSTATTIASTNDPEYTNANPGALAMVSTTVHRFWPNDADQDIYRNSSASSTETEWKDAITCQGISISAITGYIAVLYDDAGTVKYDRYALAGDATLSAVTATVTAASPVAAITGGASLTAVLATATAASPVSAITGGAAITATAAASATAASPAATLSGGASMTVTTAASATAASPSASIGISITFAAEVATVTAASPGSTWTGGAQLAGVVASATAASPAATIGGGAQLAATLATVTAASPAAEMTGTAATGATLEAVTTTVTAASPAAVISGGASMVAVTATATAASPAATLTAGASLAAQVATATAASPAATLTGTATMSAVTATATAASPASTITAGGRITAAVATVTAASPSSTWTGAAVLAAAVATATAASPAAVLIVIILEQAGRAVVTQSIGARALVTIQLRSASVALSLRWTAVTLQAPSAVVTQAGRPCALMTLGERQAALGQNRVLASVS